MIETVILLARGMLLLLAPACLFLTWRGFRAFADGQMTITQHSQAQVFFYALGVLIAQPVYLFFPGSPVLLLALLLTALSLSLAIGLRWRMMRKGLTETQQIVDRPDLTLPMVELAELDEGAAQALAQEARHRIAERRLRPCP
jgi:hypothetical protein